MPTPAPPSVASAPSVRKAGGGARDAMRRLARATPAGLMVYDSQGQYGAPRHVQYVNKLLVQFMRDVRDGKDPRWILSEPPRHGKTTLGGNYFPAWVIGNWPHLKVGYVGYSGPFAKEQGGKVRDIVKRHGVEGDKLWDVQIRDDTDAKHAWATTAGGGMRAVGRGGTITGFGFDILAIDDLVKDGKEARSVTIMDAAWEQLRSTILTRTEPGGGNLVIGTRWGRRDPIGRLIEAQKQPDWEGDTYHIINLPALAEDADPLGRAPGEALWPERWDAQRLNRRRATVGPLWFSALYQGNPTPDSGILFSREDFRYYAVENASTLPHKDAVLVLRDDAATSKERRIPWRDCSVVAFMDPAMTEGALSAYTVITVWAITPQADLVLVDVIRRKVEGTKHASLMDSARARWGQDLLIVVESGAYGFHAIQEQRLLGKNIRAVRAEKDKVARARVAEARYNSHKVFHPLGHGGSWLAAFEDELLTFPNGEYKDQVDTTAYAAAWTAYGEYLSDTSGDEDLNDLLSKIF